MQRGALLVALALAGCATTGGRAPVDPFEPFNRAMFAIHEPIDTNLVAPAIKAYREHTPRVLQQVIANFFNNIDDLFSAINGLLQNQPESAGHDLGRVMINTGFGIGGLIDFATEAGIPRGNRDFGQTFGVWGFEQGPYLFVPIFGPTTIRDGTGWIVRFYTGPVGFIPDVPLRNTLYGVGAVHYRAEVDDAVDLTAKAALDPYTFIRRAYLQRRQFLVYEGKPPKEPEDE